MQTNNMSNVNLNHNIPANNSLTILEFHPNKDENKDKEYIDAKLVAFNVRLI